MAHDYAAVIATEFGGRVDIAIGMSMGGLIVQYLAANRPDCADTFVVVGAACGVSEWGKALTRRDAAAVASGDRTERGLTVAEALLPGGHPLAASPARAADRADVGLHVRAQA